MLDWLILADRAGVGLALAESLRANGRSCELVYHGDDESVSEKLRHALRARDATSVLGVVHLWSLDALEANELTVARLNEAQRLGCQSAIELVQELVALAASPGPRVWLVTRGAQPVGDAHGLPGLAQSPLWGLGRVLPEEHPALWGGLIDLDPDLPPEQSGRMLCDELLSPDDEDQVAYRLDQRFGARLVRRSKTAVTYRPLRWRTDASYLITGGLGDLGLRVARWMVDQGAHHLVLLGRSPMPARHEWDEAARGMSRQAIQMRALRALEASGAAIHVAAVDVADEAGMQGLFDRLASEGWPPVRGVVHAAGVRHAWPLTEIQPAQLAGLFRPKVMGAWLLHQRLRDERLDFFVCFSSGAALLGSPLTAGYAAANTFMDALAHQRHAAGQSALSINWGFWELGDVERSQRQVGPDVVPQGMRPITTDVGLTALRQLLEQGATQTAVMRVDLDEWRRVHPRANTAPLLANLRLSESEIQQAAERDEGPLSAPRDAILAAPGESRRGLAEDYLRQQIGRVLRRPPEKLGLHQSLNNLGIDSLMAVELRNHVQAHLGVTVPLARLLQDPTIAQLTQTILDQLPGSIQPADQTASAPLARADTAPTEQSAATTLGRIDELSDEEVDAMLRQLLRENDEPR